MEKRKRTIFWIIPIAVLGIFFYFFGPQKTITDNEYIAYIKDTPVIENNTVTTGAAFTSYCEESRWEYFQTKMMEHVVEFKGKCQVENDVQPVNLQYVVEKGKKTHHLGVLLVNSVQQTEEERTAFINSVVH